MPRGAAFIEPNSARSASRPPAEAPMPTMKSGVAFGCRFAARFWFFRLRVADFDCEVARS
jgi:hypothetical protein